MFFVVPDLQILKRSAPLKKVTHKFFADIGCTNYLPVYPLRQIHPDRKLKAFDEILFSLIFWRSRHHAKHNFFFQSSDVYGEILGVDRRAVSASLLKLKRAGLLQDAKKPQDSDKPFKPYFYIPKAVNVAGKPFLIPLEVLRDDYLSWDQKLIYGEICYKFSIQEKHGIGKFKTMEGFIPLGKKRLIARVGKTESFFWKNCKELAALGLVDIQKRMVGKTITWFYALNPLANYFQSTVSFEQIENAIIDKKKSKRQDAFKRSAERQYQSRFSESIVAVGKFPVSVPDLDSIENKGKEEINSYNSNSYSGYYNESLLKEENAEQQDPVGSIIQMAFRSDLAPSVLDPFSVERRLEKKTGNGEADPPTPLPYSEQILINRTEERLEARKSLGLTIGMQSIKRVRNIKEGRAKSILWMWFKAEVKRKAIVGERFHEEALGVSFDEAYQKLMRKYKGQFKAMKEIGAKAILESGKTPYFTTLGMIVHTRKGDVIVSSDWRMNKELNEAKRIKDKEERKQKQKEVVEKALSKMQVAADVKVNDDSFFISPIQELEPKSNRLDVFAKEIKKSQLKDKSSNYKIDKLEQQEGESRSSWFMRVSKRLAIDAYEKFFLDGVKINVDKIDLSVLDSALRSLVRENKIKDTRFIAAYIERISHDALCRKAIGLWQMDKCEKNKFPLRQIFSQYNLKCVDEYIRQYEFATAETKPDLKEEVKNPSILDEYFK